MHVTTHLERRKEVVLFDETNPRALCNLLPVTFVKHMKNAWDSPENTLFRLEEKALHQELKKQNAEPNPTDNRLRMQFWVEYDRVQKGDEREARMSVANIMGFLITKEVFYTYYISNPRKLIWLLCPPLSYVQHMEETLFLSMEKVRQMVEAVTILNVGDGSVAISDKNMQFLFRVNRDLHARYCALNGLPFFDIDGIVPKKASKKLAGEKSHPDETPEDTEKITLEESIAEKKREIEELRKKQSEAVGAINNQAIEGE